MREIKFRALHRISDDGVDKMIEKNVYIDYLAQLIALWIFTLAFNYVSDYFHLGFKLTYLLALCLYTMFCFIKAMLVKGRD